MKTNFHKKLIFSLLATTCIATTQTFAATEYQTFESKVVVDSTAGTPYLKVVGPDRVVYRISGQEKEIQAIKTELSSDPNLVLNFNGDFVDEGGTRVFRLNNWKRTVTETTKTTTDQKGNVQVEKNTETKIIK